MAPDKEKVIKAFKAMKSLGICADTVKPVLKRLMKLYNGDWKLIEEDNYRTLADAIFEAADDEEKAEPPSKKIHREIPLDQTSSTSGDGKSIADLEVKENSRMKMSESSQSFSRDCRTEPDNSLRRNKGKNPIRAPTPEENSSARLASGSPYADHEPNHESGSGVVKTEMMLDHENGPAIAPIQKQAMDRSSQFTMRPSNSFPGLTDTSQHTDKRKKINGSCSSNNHQTLFSTTQDIASSICGQIKLSLTCNQETERHHFYRPNTDEILSFVERKYKKFFRNMGANISMEKLLIELCEGYLEMAADPSNRSNTNRGPGNLIHRSVGSAADLLRVNHSEGDRGKTVPSVSESSVPPRGLMIHDNRKRAVHKVCDITNGTEKVKISLLDEIGNEDLPQYIYSPENIVYQSAYVHVSLARISDDDCCSGCIGDCLSSSIPCACARNTGGEFAYTPEGLLYERFLESCLGMKRAPQHHHLFYCQDCPSERAKNVYMPEKCKGHLLRKFIKECWRKCGCTMQCGNRVVQRGITRKLQVFLTSEGKGWGLRTLEALPKGAFVCEYAGEILTNIELYERNKRNKGRGKHIYPVLLDADWATEEVLKDEDALCLDATYYGNIARFINHRCSDGNLLEIPVQVETPDRHYYHLAFFTNRKVEALEELTWDYGIDFDDQNHPIKAFHCNCGSPHCRDRRGRKY